jgi:MFS family permease
MRMEYLRTAVRLPREVRLFLLTSALVGFTVFGGVSSVLVNLYLVRLGYGPEFIGMYLASGMLALTAMCLPAGAIGTRWGSRRALMLGLGAACAGGVMISFAELLPAGVRAPWLFGANALSSTGLALYFVNANPFLTSSTGPEERGRAFALQAALWPLAGFGGSLAGGVLPGVFAGVLGLGLEDAAPYRYPLLISALLLVPGVVVLLQIRPAAQGPARETHTAGGRAPVALMALIGVVVLLQVAGEGVARSFANVYLDTSLGVATVQIGALLAVSQLAAAPVALLTPLFVARFGHSRTFTLAAFAMAASLLPLALIEHWLGVGVGYLGVMVFAGVSRLAITVLQMELVAPRWRPTMSAVGTMAATFSWAMLAFGGGFVASQLGFSRLFLGGAALTLLGVLIFWLAFRSPRRSSAGAPVEVGAPAEQAA